MVAKDLINNTLPSLKSTDTVDKALDILNDAKLSQMPCLDNLAFLGIYSEDILLNYDPETKLSDIPPIYNDITLLPDLPLLEIIKTFHNVNSATLPVVDDQNVFLGIVERMQVYSVFINQLKLYETGSIIEIKLESNNYSLTEISRLIENENAKIISLFINSESEATFDFNNQTILLTLKLNVTQISSIINALSRFGYEVVSYFSTEPVANLEKDRYDLLMKYLNI